MEGCAINKGTQQARKDKLAEKRDSFVIGKNADIYVVTYKKRGRTIKGVEKCTVFQHDGEQERNSVVDYEQLVINTQYAGMLPVPLCLS